MMEHPKDRLSSLRAKIELQRNTVTALKRDGHECTDAERQLRQMQFELLAAEKEGEPAPR